MADDQPIWGYNRAVAPIPRAAIIAVDLGDNFTVKRHHLSMIKDRQFDERSRADPHKHIAKFVEVCGMFCYGDTNVDAIKLKLFPSPLAEEAKIWFNELSPDVISTWEEMRQAFLLEDRVLLKLDWSKENKAKPLRKTVAFAESDENSPLLEKMEALTTRIDSHFKEIRGDMKEMRDGCNKCGGPYPSSDCDDKPMGGPKEEEANYASRGYRGNYYGRNPSNCHDRQYYHRDENRNSNPGEENPPIPRLPEKKPDESGFEKTMREFIIAQKTTNDFFKNQFYNIKTKVEQGQKNHQAAIQDLETKYGRISDRQSSRPPGMLPSNTQTNPKPLTSNENPYQPTPARNEHVNDVFTRSGMPNYGKFLKDLVSNKSKMEQISAVFLTEECSAIIQNKIPPKLGDPKSFLIPCKLANSVEYLALIDLGASINLMPYSLYAA
nr:reverse transcriptase domain-containing protein [Tanacetum cinerariifolium]